MKSVVFLQTYVLNSEKTTFIANGFIKKNSIDFFQKGNGWDEDELFYKIPENVENIYFMARFHCFFFVFNKKNGRLDSQGLDLSYFSIRCKYVVNNWFLIKYT